MVVSGASTGRSFESGIDDQSVGSDARVRSGKAAKGSLHLSRSAAFALGLESRSRDRGAGVTRRCKAGTRQGTVRPLGRRWLRGRARRTVSGERSSSRGTTIVQTIVGENFGHPHNNDAALYRKRCSNGSGRAGVRHERCGARPSHNCTAIRQPRIMGTGWFGCLCSSRAAIRPSFHVIVSAGVSVVNFGRVSSQFRLRGILNLTGCFLYGAALRDLCNFAFNFIFDNHVALPSAS